MKKSTLIILIALVSSVVGCNKKNEIKKPSKQPDLKTVSTTIVSMTPADVCAPVLDDLDEDHRYYCAYYQLADAMRACMTDNILQYIYDQQLNKIANPSDLESSAIYYEDLFIAFPTLEASIDAYLGETDYPGLTYEYDDFESLSAAFVWKEEEEAAAIWIPNIEDLPSSFTLVTTDYVIATPIQIDLEDYDSEDRIFAWEYEGGAMTTVSIGQSAAVALATNLGKRKPTLVSGTSRKKGPRFTPQPPYINNNPPFTTTVPSGEYVKIDQIRIDERYERNKKSEVKLMLMSGNFGGTSVYSSAGKIDVAEVHKNDINTNRGVSPVTICENISHTDDKVFVYNLYEHDWFVTSDNWSAGGIVNKSTGSWTQKMYMRCEHSNEYYMFDPNNNHQDKLTTRIANPVCYLVHTNGHTYHTGKGNNEAKLSRY